MKLETLTTEYTLEQSSGQIKCSGSASKMLGMDRV